ncbi:MAG: CbiX/SirB N-terminal domain-containing protein [Mariprofundus sp.]|nr:CbiX/SirB N-terminal domain-containing protein [Mariprofundus sp.]
MKILLAHGSSDSRHGEQVKTLACKVSDLLGEEIGTAFLDDHALPEDATVLPLFLGQGKHVREDIPALIAASGCRLLPPLDHYADTIADMAVGHMTKETRRINALFVLYRFAGFEKLAAALYGRMKICSKHALASLHSEPSVNTVLQHWQQEDVKVISLQPMLLFEGKSMDRLRAMTEPFEISVAPVLSEHDGFAAWIADCLREKT